MGIYLNPDNELFRRDIKAPIYVDKSLLMEKLNNVFDSRDNLVCISRPRRFGKTMATNLISAYYSKGCDSREMFSKLKIAQTPDWDVNLNKCNVIKLDIQGMFNFAADENSVVDFINKSINEELIEAFPDVKLNLNEPFGLSISRIYQKTKEKFIIIMDEYDVMIRNNVKQDVLELYLKFLNGLFKNNSVREAIHFAYLTGILPIIRDKVQSKLNEFTEYSMTVPDELSGFIGFTEDEVKDLCEKYNISFEECKAWYNGYRLGNETAIYNPCSVVKSIKNKKFADYWTLTGSYESIKKYIMLDFEGLREDIVTMIGGGKLEVNVAKFMNTMDDFHSKDNIFTYLIHLGYLTYDEDEKTCWIPNNEIRSEWINAIEDAEDFSPVIDVIKNSKKLLQDTLEMNEDEVAKALNKAHTIASNPKNYNNEGALQAAICLAYFYAKTTYTIIQEATTGKGYADVLFIPRIPDRPAIVVELKVNKSAGRALKQIENKEYGQDLQHYKDNMLFVGINYDKDTKKHECKIVKC